MIPKRTGRVSNKGFFHPKNPDKYIGNAKSIIFRSSWELLFFKWLDKTPGVLQWASEEFSIPYISPLDNKLHQYYPDALIIYKDKTGAIKKEIIEIKPYKETVLTPRATEQDKLTLLVNKAKWDAAGKFASAQGMLFRILTEKNSMFFNVTSKRKR
jgi:hypothetical protein